MRLNLEKCVMLQCYRTFSPLITSSSYTIENHILENVNQQQCLSVMLDRTMSFTKNINNKASKVLNFVKRNLSTCLQSTKETAYSILVLFNPPWNMLAHRGTLYITSIEKIQRRAAHWVLNDYGKYSQSPSTINGSQSYLTLEN